MQLTRRHVQVLIESAHNFLCGVQNVDSSTCVGGRPAISEEERYKKQIARLNEVLDGIIYLPLDGRDLLERCHILCMTASLPYTIHEYPEGLDWEWVQTRNAAIIAVVYNLHSLEPIPIKLSEGIVELA